MVELVEAQVVRPLRRVVLRPDQPAECSEYPADDDRRAAHVAVRRAPQARAVHGDSPNAEVIAVGTVYLDPPPWEPDRIDGWRVRGMATRHDARRNGLGGLVLGALLDHVAAQGGALVWCNARVGAQSLYARAGFTSRGDIFDIPGIGPHIQMWRELTDRHSLTDESGTGETPG